MRPPVLLMALAALAAAPLFAAAPADSSKPPVDSSKLFDALTACRAVAGDAARLACFDKAASALDAAKANKDIVVLDRETVNKTRRGLFGFTLPSLAIFGSKDDGKDGRPAVETLKSIDGVVAAARPLAYGKWQITLEDGANWQTTEVVTGRDPKVGQKLKIERGPMGGYILSFDGGRSFRVARVN